MNGALESVQGYLERRAAAYTPLEGVVFRVCREEVSENRVRSYFDPGKFRLWHFRRPSQPTQAYSYSHMHSRARSIDLDRVKGLKSDG